MVLDELKCHGHSGFIGDLIQQHPGATEDLERDQHFAKHFEPNPYINPMTSV